MSTETALTMAEEAEAFRTMPDEAYADLMNGRATVAEALDAPRPVSVSLGYDVRTWTTYTITDATPEELATLGELDSPEALALLRQMDAAGRLTEAGTFSDDAADPFAEEAHPAVVDLNEEQS